MARHSAESGLDASQLVFITRGLSESDIAAVTAVLSAAVAEQSTRQDPRADAGPSAWQRSQRNLRSPLHPGQGAWRSFG